MTRIDRTRRGTIANLVGHLGITWTWVASSMIIVYPCETFGGAADCYVKPSSENYLGCRYKAKLEEDELSETGWMLVFGGSGFTHAGGYGGHFISLMIKGSWASLYEDGLCRGGWPPQPTRDEFGFEFGLSDYEDWLTGSLADNDMGIWSRDPNLFPRVFMNIDGTDPLYADIAEAEYQVDRGGSLKGREIVRL